MTRPITSSHRTNGRPIPGSLAAIARLTQAGFRVAVTTNQSGVGRGLFSEAVLGDIHRKMLQEVEQAGGRIERIFYCPHGPDEGCDCRKPRPGLIYQATEEMPCPRSNIVLIGDTLRDLEAAQAADIKALLVRTGKGAATEKQPAGWAWQQGFMMTSRQPQMRCLGSRQADDPYPALSGL